MLDFSGHKGRDYFNFGDITYVVCSTYSLMILTPIISHAEQHATKRLKFGEQLFDFN